MATSTLSAIAEKCKNHTMKVWVFHFMGIFFSSGERLGCRITFPEGGVFLFTGLIRTIILYLFIIAGIRLMGKRQVGELEPSELVMSLIIADLAAVPMQDYGIPLLTGLIPILALLALTMILSMLTMRSIKFRTLLCGRPSIIICKGELDIQEMHRNRLTVDELLEDLRAKGYTDPSQVYYAILETNGQLSVLPRAACKPPTNQQLQHNVPDDELPIILVSDGQVMDHNLECLGHNRAWLSRQLNGASPSSLFLVMADSSGVIYQAKKGAAT